MKIVVGEGSCGIAAGAAKVYAALEKELAPRHELTIAGCIGMCYLEPIVDIYSDSGELTRLVQVSETDAVDIARAVESGDLSAAAEAHDLTATTVTYGQDNNSSLNEDLKAAADELGEGEFSDVVKTDSAYYVIYMESLFDEEATETERQNVLADREQEAYDNWLNPLREAAEITVNDEVLNTIPLEKIFNMKQEETNTEESTDTDTTNTDTTNTDTTNTETTDTDTTDEETADDAASTDAAEETEAK